MKKKVRFFTVALALVIALSSFTGCTGKNTSEPSGGNKVSEAVVQVPDYMNATGFPIVKKPITLRGMIKIPPQGGNHDEVIGWKEYEKMTGIHIDWEQLTGSALGEKRALGLASGDYPDLYYCADVTQAELDDYGESGIFLALDDYINKFGPNYKKILSEYTSIRKGMASLDGKMYSLPFASVCEPYLIFKKYINIDWLNAVGMKMPTTTDELYAVLKAFKTKDPNGNGKDDEIPLTNRGIDYTLQPLRGAWGLGNRGLAYNNWDADPKDSNKVRYIPTTTQFREVLQYANKLYAEGLLDKTLSNSVPNLVQKFTSNTVGAHDDYPTNAGPELRDKFIAAPVLKGPGGEQQWTRVRDSIGAKGAFVITNNNKYPEATMRWADYFYSEDGMRMYNLGFEGITYKKTADGKYQLIDDIINNPDGLTLDAARNKYILFYQGPSVLTDKYFQGSEMYRTSVEGTELLKPYIPKERWELFNFTREEREKIRDLEGVINPYVNQMKNDFITGKAPLTGWDDYVAQLKNLGNEELIKLYQTGLDRYNKN